MNQSLRKEFFREGGEVGRCGEVELLDERFGRDFAGLLSLLEHGGGAVVVPLVLGQRLRRPGQVHPRQLGKCGRQGSLGRLKICPIINSRKWCTK